MEKGTPMSNLTREEAIAMLKSKMDGSVDTSYEWAETVRMAIEALEDRPQGEWKPKNNHTDYCSNCGFEEVHWRTVDYDYCPNCNAEMGCE